MTRVRESAVEAHLVARIRLIGGECLKNDPQSRIGIPDRLVILPGGEVIWVEVKAAGGVLSPVQERVHARLRELTQEVRVVWSKSQINRLFPIEETEPEDEAGC